MHTFKNIHYNRKANYECTVLVFCQAGKAPSSDWVECDAAENNMQHLYTQAGVRYFGIL